MKRYIIFLGLCFAAFSLRANTIHVPGDSLITIQTAIDSSVSGDTVLVQPGTYVENITIGKNIVLASLFLTTGDTSYVSTTIIDAPGSVVVIFGGGRDSTCILTGLTITGGNSTMGYGGAIRCVNASPTISHNIIRDNAVVSGTGCWGGGIYLEVNSSPKIIYNQILNNSATYSTTSGWGGGIYSKDSDPFIAYNTISGNSADVNGGGIYFLNSQVHLYDNTINANSSQYGGGIYCDGNSSGIISGNTIHTDSAWYGGGIYLNANTDVDVIRNIVHSNYASGNTAGLHNGSSLSTINNNTFCLNQSPTMPALNSIGTDTVYHNIFYGNIGTGAVFTGYLKNCDFWGNTGGDFLTPPPAGTGVLSTVNINGDSCDVFGNIFLNPLFADDANFDFHLTQNSPCIDAGDPAQPSDPDGTRPDLGALYFNQMRPVILTSDTLLDFGSVEIGQSLDLTFALYNGGTDSLRLQNMINQHPVFTHNWNPADSLILPGDSLTVTVTFTPVDTNLIDDTLWIENNDKPLQVQLSGKGKITLYPLIIASDSLLDFGTVNIEQHLDLQLTLQNGGTDSLCLYNMSNQQSVFTHNWSPADSLILPGDSLTVTVTFTPVDTNLIVDTLWIENNDKLLQVLLSGKGKIVVGIVDQTSLPTVYSLSQNYPNPFNPVTIIKYGLPENAPITLVIYDLGGQEIWRYSVSMQPAGWHQIQWNGVNNLGKSVSTGVYYYRLRAGDFVAVKKMVLMK